MKPLRRKHLKRKRLTSNRPGGFGCLDDIWVSTRPTTHEPFGPPAALGPPVNNPVNNSHPTLSSDGCTLYFSCDVSDGSDVLYVSVLTMADASGHGSLMDLWQAPILSLLGDSKPIGPTDPAKESLERNNEKEVMLK